MKLGKLILSVEIENYSELKTARTVTEFFEHNQTVKECLFHLASKSNVQLDLSDRKDECFDLYFVDEKGSQILMDKTAQISKYNLIYKQLMILRKTSVTGKRSLSMQEDALEIPTSPTDRKSKKLSVNYEKLREGKLVLAVEIFDYLQLNCVRTFSDFFNYEMTVHATIFQIAKKNSVGLDLSGGKDQQFELYSKNSKGQQTPLEKNQTLGFYSFNHKDTVILKKVSA